MNKIMSMVIAGLLILVTNTISLAQEKIIIAGTGDSQQILRVLARTFEKANPGKVIEIPDSIGSGGGIKMTAIGESDLGRVARPIKEKEKKYHLNYKLFAYTPIVFVINPSVRGINNLTIEQLTGIYTGKYTNWDVLGGEEGKIYVVSREFGDSSKNILENNLPGFKDNIGKVIFTTPETVKTIGRYKNTIGYLPLAMAVDTDLIVIKVDGVYPSADNIRNESYKFVTPLGIVWKGELKGLAKTFLSFLSSPEARKIVFENGSVPALR